MWSFYLAFLRLTSPIPGKGCPVTPNGREKCVILHRVFAFDFANPWEGVTRHADNVSFYDAFDARPGQSMVRVAFPTEASELAPALERIFKL